MNEYEVTFKGRLIGAIGIFHEVKITVSASSPLTTDEIENMIYKTYEHVSLLKIDEIKRARKVNRESN